MTTLKDIINDFGKEVVEIQIKTEREEIQGDEEYDLALDECMERVKKLMGTEQ